MNGNLGTRTHSFLPENWKTTRHHFHAPISVSKYPSANNFPILKIQQIIDYLPPLRCVRGVWVNKPDFPATVTLA